APDFLAVGDQPHALAAPRVGPAAGQLGAKLDRARDALDGQLALHEEVVPAGLDARGPEGDLRMALDVEEVGGPEVLVAPLRSRVDAGRPNGALRLRLAVLADGQRAVEVGEEPLDGDQTHVADLELDARVNRVHLPGSGGENRRGIDCGGAHGISLGVIVAGATITVARMRARASIWYLKRCPPSLRLRYGQRRHSFRGASLDRGGHCLVRGGQRAGRAGAR